VIASPVASAATSATSATGCPVYAIATQTAACTRPTVVSSSRLSNRSASRPPSDPNAIIGSVEARSSAATAKPP
jgi:hypothetical protein